ncbi:MAG: RNA 2'-phosphotransferase [Myxococcales bacterium]
MPRTQTEQSKHLAYVLRHAPESVGLTLDQEGWVGVDELIEALGKDGEALDRAALEEIVRTDSKGRYQLQDGRIRAVQGHSTSQVDRTFEEREPPARLFHGTTSAAWPAIQAEGLKPMDRQYVHLSIDVRTARTVGQRHVRKGAKLLILRVDCAAMRRDGVKFFLAENDVWLVEAVSPKHLGVAE